MKAKLLSDILRAVVLGLIFGETALLAYLLGLIFLGSLR